MLDPADPNDAFAIAEARIAQEAADRTGVLDLTDLALETVPEALFELRHLRVLSVGYLDPQGRNHRRLLIGHHQNLIARFEALEDLCIYHSDFSSLEPVRDLVNLKFLACLSSEIASLAPLAGLSALTSLKCWSTQVQDLSPLAGLAALTSLDCGSTQVQDLSPLAGLSALASLDCSRTKVQDLSPLAGLTALTTLNCSDTQVQNLSPLAGLVALASLNCSYTQVQNLSPLAGLTALTTLNCSDTQVQDLSPLAGLTALTTLNCSDTQVQDLSPLAGLTALALLNCSHTQVQNLSPLAGLTALALLNCSHTQVQNLSPLAGLTALASLNCSYTQVQNLSPLAGLTALASLDCSDTQVQDLSPLAGLTALTSLDCSGTHVQNLSPLAGLAALASLDCSYTQIQNLSPLAGLTALASLDCSRTHVQNLSPLAGLTALTSLDCSNTQVQNLSPLAGLTALASLDCSNTQVQNLSPLAGLTALTSLYCSYTQVQNLSPLAGLTALTSLYCSHTQVQNLSPLAGLSALASLDCNLCHLRSLSPLKNMTALKTLTAYQARVPGLPWGLLSQSWGNDCLPRLRAYWAALDAGVAMLADVRLLILGNGSTGKSQIAARLSGGGFDDHWDSTHGIRIIDHSSGGDPPATLHIWDFGGQDIYLGTHALFLQGPAVIMLVWSEDIENTPVTVHQGLEFQNYPLAYWAAMARHQAHEDSPIIAVKNKCDVPGRGRDSFEPGPDAFEPGRFYEPLYISARHKHGLPALEEALGHAADHLRAMHGMAEIGAGWLRVQRRLEAMRAADAGLAQKDRRHRFIEQQEFLTLCAAEGGGPDPAALLHYLDANGAVFYREGLFQDRIILDQAWALDAIYTVFDRNGTYQWLRGRNGRLTEGDFAHIWADKEGDERRILLDMMRSCGICFEYRKSTEDADAEYIVPDLLPEKHVFDDILALLWDESAPFQEALFPYPSLHAGVIRTILSRIGDIGGSAPLYWRGGLFAYEETTKSRMLIEEVRDPPPAPAWQGAIRLRTQTGQAGLLLQKLIKIVEEVQDHFGLKPNNPTLPEHLPERPETTAMTITQPAPPEWSVSYAWGDDTTPEGIERERKVEETCQKAKALGRYMIRDKDILTIGDEIEKFMDRVAASERVFVFMSDKYLKSSFCMYELYATWSNSKQDAKDFRRRVQLYTLDDAKIWSLEDRLIYAKFWKKRHDAIAAELRGDEIHMLGDQDSREYKRMTMFYLKIGDMLAALAGVVQPKKFQDFLDHGFRP